MAHQVIRESGEDIVVREDTAKAYRGVYWALLSLAGFALITAILFFGGFFAWVAGPTSNNPAVGAGPSNSGH